jgi:hypothetical protein
MHYIQSEENGLSKFFLPPLDHKTNTIRFSKVAL